MKITSKALQEMMWLGLNLANDRRESTDVYEESLCGLMSMDLLRSDDPKDVIQRASKAYGRWTCEWCMNGFPRVVLGHKHAASLMATKTRADSIPDARAPWTAFLVDVPRGLLSWVPREAHVKHKDGTYSIESSGGNVQYALVTANGSDISIIPLADDMTFTMIEPVDGKGLAEFGHIDLRNQMLGTPDERNHASLTMISRLVLGVCMEMTSSSYSGEKIGVRPTKADPRTGEPRTWTFQLTRNVKVDCRDAVRAYSEGKSRSSPTVQCLVRGHWKQQPCGRGGADRKNIFVEPYWRGPEDAPIASRNHLIVSPDDAQSECDHA